MKHCFKKAYAKINLTLDVLGIRDDGYHELCMVMQQVSLCDTIAVGIGFPWEGIRVVSNIGFLPCDDRNIAYKAAKLFLEETGLSASVMEYILGAVVKKKFGGKVKSSEIGLPVTETGMILPCGASAIWEKSGE